MQSRCSGQAYVLIRVGLIGVPSPASSVEPDLPPFTSASSSWVHHLKTNKPWLKCWLSVSRRTKSTMRVTTPGPQQTFSKAEFSFSFSLPHLHLHSEDDSGWKRDMKCIKCRGFLFTLNYTVGYLKIGTVSFTFIFPMSRTGSSMEGRLWKCFLKEKVNERPHLLRPERRVSRVVLCWGREEES